MAQLFPVIPVQFFVSPKPECQKLVMRIHQQAVSVCDTPLRLIQCLWYLGRPEIAWDSYEFTNGNRTELSAHTAGLWLRVDCQLTAANGLNIARASASECSRTFACTHVHFASMASSTAVCRAYAHPRDRSWLLAGQGHACASRLHVGLKLLVIAPWLICMH